MKVYIGGSKTVNLTKNDFIAKGGEGEVYGKGTKIYKIYLKPKNMIPDGKILELQKLNSKNILNPLDIILNKNKKSIGFTMNWIKDTVSLCQLFTNDFRKRNNISIKEIVELVKKIKEIVTFVHQKKCIIVDMNELNFLVENKTYTEPFFIDVDSYQTQSYKATAIMPYVRDYHTNSFNETTDWYSFGILACQLFVGIHPFKGKHPNYSKKELIKRMKENVSIFNNKVTVPSATRDFTNIPDSYRAWFVDMFENGKRIAPPETMSINQKSVIGKVLTIVNNCDFDIKLINEVESDILHYFVFNGTTVIKTKDKILLNKQYYISANDTEIIFEEKNSFPLFVEVIVNKLHVGKIDRSNSAHGYLDLDCKEKLIVDNVLYARNEGKLIELKFNSFNNKIIPSVRNVWDIMPNSSKIFSGFIYQDILGKPYITIPDPKNKSCHVIIIQELEGFKIIEAKHDNKICMLKVFKDNEYSKVTIIFDTDYKKYIYKINDMDDPIINFVVLKNDVVVSIEEDGLMKVFSNRINQQKVRQINNKIIKTAMKLFKDGISVYFADKNKLYGIKMK